MCGCGAANKNNSSTHRQVSVARQVEQAPCDITKEHLLLWKQILTCIKQNNYFVAADTPEFTINKFLGIVQSALNYPSDYCYFNEQLNYFKTFVLLKIIDNVPQCIN